MYPIRPEPPRTKPGEAYRPAPLSPLASGPIARLAAPRYQQPAAPPAGAPSPVRVDGLRWSSTADTLSVIVALSGPLQWEQGRVRETHTVYFDLQAAHFGPLMDDRSIDLTSPLVRRIVLAENRPGLIRLAVSQAPGVGEAVVAMYFPNPSRLVISLRAQPPVLAARASPPPRHAVAPPVVPPAHGRAATIAAAAPPAAPLANGDRSLTRALGLKIGRIVLDAGHGGHDSGTVGPNGLDEKDVVLDVVLRLGRLLRRRLGADVIYTRRDDTFIPLRERTAIANRAHADLFVSVHANANLDPNLTGVATYYLNRTDNPQALSLAARENATSELGEHELQDLVQAITTDDKRQESRALCADLASSLARGLDEDDLGVKSAPFIVLIGARMPSVLAEISFLSNRHDAHLMSEPRYRQRIATALYQGIARYIVSLGGVQAVLARQDMAKPLGEAAAAAAPGRLPHR